MKGLSESAALLSWNGPVDGYFHVKMAINGIPAIPFSFPATHLDNMDEVKLGQYLERQARTLIDRYGDARNPLPESIITDAEKATFNDLHGN